MVCAEDKRSRLLMKSATLQQSSEFKLHLPLFPVTFKD
jgi:hypothetical protein